MKPRKMMCFVVCLRVWSACVIQGQSESQEGPGIPGGPAEATQDSSAPKDRFGNVRRLPSWVRLGFEFRGRSEFSLDPDQDRDDRFYLNRLRVSATVQPARTVR